MRILIRTILASILTTVWVAIPQFPTNLYIDTLYIQEVEKKDPLELTILNTMSIEEKVGQLFMFGLPSTYVDENFEDLLINKHIGGVLLLGKNINTHEQLKTLISDLQSNSKIPLFIAIDQEGGTVARLKGSKVLTISPRDILNNQQAYEIAYERGVILKNLGINMNLAPVVEYVTDKNSFMYKRVFTGNKEEVCEKAIYSVDGYINSNTIAVPKHFPGHSNTSVDPHYVLPKVNITNEQWNEYTYTFRCLIEGTTVEIIMIGHISYPNIDSKPSTISSEILSNRLREELKFDGVIITDDLEMDSIEEYDTYTNIAKDALLAGNDILMYSSLPTVQREVYEHILQSVIGGEIEEEIINKKVLRILKVKIKYGILEPTQLLQD